MYGNKSEEISMKEIFHLISSLWNFLLSKWKRIAIGAVLGAFTGLLFAFFTPVKYTSKLTFVVEESKASAGGIAAIAGQFGFDLGGMTGGGVFSGDNILLFLKSEQLCKQTLMTPIDVKGNQNLIDKYIEIYGLKDSWAKNEKIGNVQFSKYSWDKLPRMEDSLMQFVIRKKILDGELTVSKPDKKATFIEVSTTMRNEQLSKLFSERLVAIATEQYVQSKTRVKLANVMNLQRRADSLLGVLNARTVGAAVVQQGLIDANPAMRTAPVQAEITSRDKTIAATIFAEVVKNLEISKTVLNQETPVIQMVDVSSLPLPLEKTGKLKALIAGMFLGTVVASFLLILIKWFLKLKAGI
jgi:hypothetical protein